MDEDKLIEYKDEEEQRIINKLKPIENNLITGFILGALIFGGIMFGLKNQPLNSNAVMVIGIFIGLILATMTIWLFKNHYE